MQKIKSYWLKFSEILGWINSRIIMFILFFFLFVPIGLILKLFGKDLLSKKINKNIDSYWINRKDQPGDFKLQF